MSNFSSPKPGANITLIAQGAGRRVQGQFVGVLGADWDVVIKKADIDWLYSVSAVEMNFIMNGQVCTAKAEVGTVDVSRGRCLLLGVHAIQSRPLRGQDRVAVELPCALILQGKEGGGSEYINSRQSCVSNISRSGARLSINRPLDAGERLLLLFALDSHPELPPPDHRLMAYGRIVREAKAESPAYRFHYGIQFSVLPPGFFAMLSSYVDYIKSPKPAKSRVA